jgi:ATP-dependent DNA helicase RecQ
MCDNCLSEEVDLVDVTVEAQKFLSCVKRTGERFGSAHLIDVLRGSKAKKVFQFGHQTLSTYGIGKDYSKKQWQQLSRQFLHKGLLVQDMEFGSLKLTDNGWTVLRGDKTVLGYLDPELDVAPFVDEPARTDDLTSDDRLFEILRSKRKELADETGVPPYVIFSDKTLIEMAVFFPQSSDSLLDIHGVGAVKCKKFGELFLNIIRMYCRENQIEERPKRAGRPLRSGPAKGP